MQPRQKAPSKNRNLRMTPRFRLLLILAVCTAAILIAVFVIYPNTHAVPEGQKVEAPPPQETSTAPELEDVSDVDLAGKLVIVDAGHGGDDIGCIGVSTGRYEKEVNLEIAQKLQTLLEENGAQVIMTRETDDAIAPTKEEDMAKREQIIRDANADMFLSIHQNEYDDDSATGPQVFFVAQGSVGKRLAVAVQDMLNDRLDIAEDERRMALPAAYQVLKPGSQPSCTVECGFFSNPEEEALLQDDAYQQKLAEAILDGIRLYVKRFPDA